MVDDGGGGDGNPLLHTFRNRNGPAECARHSDVVDVIFVARRRVAGITASDGNAPRGSGAYSQA